MNESEYLVIGYLIFIILYSINERYLVNCFILKISITLYAKHIIDIYFI